MGRTQGVKDTKKRKAPNRSNSHKTQIRKSVTEFHATKKAEEAAKKAEEAAKNKERWNQQFASGIHRPDATTAVDEVETAEKPLESGPAPQDEQPCRPQDCWDSEHNPRPIICEMDADPEGKTSDDGDNDETNNQVDAGVMHNYCQAIQSRLQQECASQGPNALPALEKKWLLDFLKDHDWCIQHYHAKTICKKLGIIFNEPSYYRDVHVWLPDIRWGNTCMPVCPRCDNNSKVTFHAWRKNHFGRKIVGLRENYVTMSRRYKCSKCLEDSDKLKDDLKRAATKEGVEIELVNDKSHVNYTFMAWNSRSLQMMSHGRGNKFPAELSYRSGVDKVVVDMMRPLFDKGVRPEALSNILLELHSKKYADDYIAREQRLQQSRLNGNVISAEVGLYSDFSDKKKYDGSVPTGRYLAQVHLKQHKKIERHMDLEVKKRPATRLHFDVSYKEAKLLFRYGGKQLFKGLCTVTNELGEIRMQFHVFTDDHDQYTSAVQAFLRTTELYGQPEVELVFSDNPRADKDWMQQNIPSLLRSEHKMNHAEIIPAKDNSDSVDTYTISQDQVVCVSGLVDIRRKAIALRDIVRTPGYGAKILGLDAEWKVTRNNRSRRIIRSGRVAIIQIAYKDSANNCTRAVIFQVLKLKNLPQELVNLLTDEGITFVGVNVGGDVSRIATSFDCERIVESCKVINLGKFCRERNIVGDGKIGLASLSKLVLDKSIPKDDRIRCSNWETSQLSAEQQNYAAIDAIASLEIYFKISMLPNLSARLDRSEVKENMDVDVVPSKGNVLCMASRAAIGVLLNDDSIMAYPAKFSIPTAAQQHNSVKVQINKVLAPSLIVPNIKMGRCDVCLGDFGEAPFTLHLPLKMLKHHDIRTNIRITPDHETRPALDRNELELIRTRASSNKSGDGDCRPGEVMGEEGADELIPSSPNDALDSIDMDADEICKELHGSDIDYLRRLRDIMDQEQQTTRLPMKHRKLSDPPHPAAIENRFSSVLGDGFHVMDRAKIPVKHNVKKLYKVAFRDALFAWEPDSLSKLKQEIIDSPIPEDSLNGEITDHYNSVDVERMMYFNADFFKACVERRILPPKELYWRVRAVFVTFGDMIDAGTNKPLFNDHAWKKADNILREILEGLISDPPGHSFYTVAMGADGSPVTNEYGFDILFCNRGTNDVENFHKHLIATFANWHNGLEMSDCLLRERRHRHNQKISERRRFGYPTVGHFDSWKIDQMQNLVEMNHGVLLYPYWSNASDLKQTDESLGTVCLHNDELETAIAAIPIPEDVNFSNELKYLMNAMGTPLPVLPILTREERQLFSKLVLESLGKIDEHNMALDWCKYVDGITIFPKLPVHLRTYFVQWSRNQSIKDVQKESETKRNDLKDLNALLMPVHEEAAGAAPDDDSDSMAMATPSFISKPNVPPEFPDIAPKARHGREATAVGNTMIYHTEAAMFMEPRKKRGDRGPDRVDRQGRTCKSCKKLNLSHETASHCPGRHPRGTCTNSIRKVG